MTQESSPTTTRPADEQIRAQVERICKNKDAMQSDVRKQALRWLVEKELRGEYDVSPKPTAKQIQLDFYTFAVEKRLIEPSHDNKNSSANELSLARTKGYFHDLDTHLIVHYGGHGKADDLIIKLDRGKWGAYRPLYEWRPTVLTSHPPAASARPDHDGDAVIEDERFITGTETRVPDRGTVWVVSPDLSNVGDEVAPFADTVRRTVRSNVARGISYSYIYPQNQAGESRVRNLKECFIGKPGKLYLYEIPAERFYEFTLVPAHFISFNPLDPAPDTYMQLPLRQAEKGWIKLGREDAERVLSKIKSLMAEYPPANAEPSNPTVLNRRPALRRLR